MHDAHFLITGGASGIGLATARLLRQQGAKLTLWDVNAAALAQAAQDLQAASAIVDVTQPQAIQIALASIDKLEGAIHCAGILHSGMFETLALDKQQRIIEVNFFGTVAVVQAVLPLLKKARGTLILAGSVAAFGGSPEEATYGASKAAVLSLAQTLRVELDGSGIHIGVFCPHFVDTPMVQQNPDVKLYQLIGNKHTADDVARAIVRGIRQRHFMIFPSLEVQGAWWLSRYGHGLVFPIVRRSWRRALRLAKK